MRPLSPRKQPFPNPPPTNCFECPFHQVNSIGDIICRREVEYPALVHPKIAKKIPDWCEAKGAAKDTDEYINDKITEPPEGIQT